MIIWIFVILILDQVSKYFVVKKLKGSYKLIKGPLILYYVENYGAAMGLMKKKPGLVKWFSVALMMIISYMFIYSESQLHALAYATVIGGGLGNIVDRFIRGYVVDFYSFKLKKLPYFNIADFFVITGCILLVISELYI